ncbi:MAG: hypothetical protein IPM45_12385 [Acidimicrobiales bacterium]|nr:hypothetical protein [Acidimicrobiales bacterium]
MGTMTGDGASPNGEGQAPPTPIGNARWRQRVRVRGRVRTMRVQPWAGAAALECTIYDDTGGLVVIFLGRKRVGGVSLGRIMEVEGMVGAHRGYLAILNPSLTLVGPQAAPH